MNRILSIAFLFLAVLNLTAQGNTYTSAKDSDPEAKKILDKLKKDYDSYKSLEVDFDLVLELPGQTKEVQKGTVRQSGDKFMAKVASQEIYCNGKSLWLYLKDNNEVQINDYNANTAGDMMTPKDMLRMYEDGKYAYAITDEQIVDGVLCTLIEFKPLDKNSEYFKLRLAVDKKSKKAKHLKVFSKDGSKYTLQINKLTPNPVFAASAFEFNKAKYPGVRIEDLRLD